MTNDEIRTTKETRMTKEIPMTKLEKTCGAFEAVSDLRIGHSFVIGHRSFVISKLCFQK